MAMMCCNGLQSGKLKTRSVKIGIFGLDNAGKTSTTKAIIGESLETVAPTVGYSSYKKKMGQHDITFYDLGGGKRVRDIWKHYLAEVHGLIFVVDSTEADRLTECKEELQKLLSNTKVQGKPILLQVTKCGMLLRSQFCISFSLANKQDQGNALDDKEIVARINLEDLVTQNKCHCRLELCSAHVGVGNRIDPPIRAGLKWLLRIVDVLRETAGLEQRVMMDTEEAKRIEREQAREKKLQVLKAREERLKAEKNLEKQDEEKDEGPVVDPFKPVQQAVIEAERTAPQKSKDPQPEKVPQNESSHSENAHPNIASSTMVNGTAPKLEPLKLPANEEPINSNESSPHSKEELEANGSEPSVRRRRRRPRPANGTSTLDAESNIIISATKALNDLIAEDKPAPVPSVSNLSPKQTRSISQAETNDNSKTERTPRVENTPAPIAASLRLSGGQATVEQQNSTALSTAFVRQGGPNVTSSDAFI